MNLFSQVYKCIILQVEAINQKRLIAFVNSFVSNTAGFLNRFSCVCEEKLENMSHRMQQLEITMSLLEAKVFGFCITIEMVHMKQYCHLFIEFLSHAYCM